MVEPISLTIGAISAALIAKMLDKAVDKAGEAAVDTTASATGKLFAFLRKKFRGTDAEPALKELEANPDSARREAAVAGIIDRIADEDPQFRTELSELVDQAKASDGIYLANQNLHDSPGGVQIANTPNATISINQPPKV